MLHTKSQGMGLLALEKKIFKGFLRDMGMSAILVMWPKEFVYMYANLS